jgi:hypothetical protein
LRFDKPHFAQLIFRLKDKSHEASKNRPNPDVIALETTQLRILALNSLG